ncbi:MAG: PD-(D/E)XK nuclease family protein [Thermaerobacter sp.]|nr:PD-(D/E)XK nuclease family protein [Thermaerobacter sp.]
MILHLGSPAAVHRHFRRRLEGMDPSHRAISRVVVSHHRLASLLPERVSGAPDIIVLDQWLEQVLPQHIIRAPEGTWQFLSRLVPDSLIGRAQRNVPGMLLLAADIVRRGRSAGVKAVGPQSENHLPWPELWSWYDRAFGGTVADELRLYEYALDDAKVPGDPGGLIMVYGFAHVTTLLLRLIRQWESARTVELWGLDTLIPETARARLAHWGVFVNHLDTEPEDGKRFRLCPGPGADAVDVTAQLFSSGQVEIGSAVVVETAGAPWKTIRRAFRREHLLPDEAVLSPSTSMLFRLFRMVAQGESRSAWVKRWQEAARADGGWARDWWSRAIGIRRWGEWEPLFEEAERVHGVSWPTIKRWAQRVAAWDSLGSPDPHTAASVLAGLAFDEGPPNDLPVLPPELAVWLPSRHIVLVDVGMGGFPRPVVRTPFDDDPSLRAWIRQTDPASRDAAILTAWLHDRRLSLWMVGDQMPVQTAGWSFDELKGPVRISRFSRSQRGADAIRAWYRNWRDTEEHSPYSGQLDRQLTHALMPTRLSPSALEDFGRCPLSFLMRHLLRIPEGRQDAIEVGPEVTGQWSHRALELMAVKNLPLSLKHVRTCVRNAMVDQPAPETVPALYLRYQEDRLTSELYEALLRDEWDPRRKMAVEVDLVWDWIWPMRGRIDRLEWTDDGILRLVDYKTGQSADPGRPSPSNLQLLLYQQVVSKQYGMPVQAELYGVSQRSEFKRRLLSPNAAAELEAAVRQIGQGMKALMDSGGFIPIPDPKLKPCRFCPYRLVCPAEVIDYAEAKNAANGEYTRLWTSKEAEHDAEG